MNTTSDDARLLLAAVRALRELPSFDRRREIRQGAGVSLDRLGGALDPPVTGSAVYRWESGMRAPRDLRHLVQYEALLRELAAL